MNFFVFVSSTFADLFFLELWPSLLWALVIGIASASQSWKGKTLTVFLALMPVAASAFYFGVAHASDDSFLLAGIIPWSDASMHFRQAAQMARDGITTTGMNGRFLYPAFFSSLLDMTQCDLLMAEALSNFIFASALVLALRATGRFIGAPGAMVVALVSWLFFRARCAGLIMTENFGLLCGLLALTAFLVATKKKNFWIFLLGIFLLAFGFSARPGALVVLPLMICFVGWAAWKNEFEENKFGQFWEKISSPFMRALLAAALALAITVMALGCNTLIARTLYRGKVITNQNFSFTLYGMLTGGKWSDNLTWSHWDSKLVMHESVRLIQEKPELLLFGAARAYKEALYRRILFMFHHESRPATLLLIFATIGLIALWKEKYFKPYALWITSMVVGILLSIPFIPPWDAAERPLAVTAPFQALLAGIGFFVLVEKLFSKKKEGLFFASSSKADDPFFLNALLFCSLLVFFLTVPLPMLHQQRAALFKNNVVNNDAINLRSGSFFVITPENRMALEQRMTGFLAHYPKEAACWDALPDCFILGIDWNSKNLDRCLLLDSVGKTAPFQGWQIDTRVRP